MSVEGPSHFSIDMTDHSLSVRSRRPLNLFTLSLLGIVMGIGTGLGAVVFRALIAVIHNAAVPGHFSFLYDANVFTAAQPVGSADHPGAGDRRRGASPSWSTISRPKRKRPRRARGHGRDLLQGGVDPAARRRYEIAGLGLVDRHRRLGRPRGADHPDRRVARLDPGPVPPDATWQRITLVAAGAGAGIAATFNTPIGGVIFAIELMMPEVSARTFLPVALATGTATFVGRLFLGPQPAFSVPPVADRWRPTPVRRSACRSTSILGVLCGLAATGFIRGLHLAEERSSISTMPICRHGIGMLRHRRPDLCAVARFGHYYVEGVGYATIQAILWQPARHASAAGAAVRRPSCSRPRPARLRLLGRHLLAVAVHGRDPRRRVRRAAAVDPSHP